MREHASISGRRRRRVLRLLIGVALIASIGLSAHTARAQPITVTFTVTTTADTHDANLNDGVCADATGQCSLRAAVEEFNSNTSSNATDFFIKVPGGTYTLTAANGELNIMNDIPVHIAQITSTDTCPAGGSVTIAPEDSRAFYSDPETYLSLKCVTITGGDGTGSCIPCNHGPTTGYGGGILADGSLTLIDSVVTNNTAGDSWTSNARGGGIYQRGRDPSECDAVHLTITGSYVTNNTAVGTTTAYGGGLFDDCGYTTISHSSFIGNRAGGYESNEPYTPDAQGGAIFNNEVETLDTVFLRNNQAIAHSLGGSVFHPCRINDSALTFTNVRASACGGAIYSADQQTLRQVTVDHNSASATDSYLRGEITTGALAFGGGIMSAEACSLEIRTTCTESSKNSTAGIQSIGGLSSSVSLNTAQATSSLGFALAFGGGLFNGGHEFMPGGVTVLVNGNTANATTGSNLTPNGGLGCEEEVGSPGFYRGLAQSWGGGIFNTEELDMAQAIIGNNQATTSRMIGATGGYSCPQGGGLFNWSGVSALNAIKVGTNSISGFGTVGTYNEPDGGGIYHFAGNMNLSNSYVTNNTAPEHGGGVFVHADTHPSLTYNKITGNKALDEGGGLFLDGTPFLTGNTVSGNTAPECPNTSPC